MSGHLSGLTPDSDRGANCQFATTAVKPADRSSNLIPSTFMKILPGLLIVRLRFDGPREQLPMRTSLPRKPRRVTIFRICSPFNATGPVRAANGHHRVQRQRRPVDRQALRAAAVAGAARRGLPERSTWYAEPVKVFDNLYFFGQSEYAVWAITTSQGIIVLDTIFDYSVEDEVVGGMKKLGLDPANIKYAVVSHAHPDHDGGAKFLQDHYGTRVIMSPADWDVLDKRTNGTKPKRDLEATDGQKLTLGDTTITLYITPGHTPGTISIVFPVKDNGTPHLAALWGGVGLNTDKEAVQTYIKSDQRFSGIVKQAGADIILANHTDWDRSKINLPMLAKRAPGAPNPYIVGNAKVAELSKGRRRVRDGSHHRMRKPWQRA